MKNAKRIIAVLLLLLSAALLFSCGKGKTEVTGSGTETTAEATEIDPVDAPFDLVSEVNPAFDYFHEDLTPYLTLTKEDYEGLLVALDVTEEDVDEYLNDTLLPSYRTPKMATDRAVKEGDTVYIYYTGYIDDVAFEGGSNAEEDEPYALEIGSGSFIPGFEDALIGVIPADTSKENLHSITATFPAEYRNADLAGKEARFDTWIVGIFDDDWIVPELTADFLAERVKNFTPETDDSVAEFRLAIKKWMRESKAASLESHKFNRTLETLFDSLSFGETLPEGEVERIEAVLTDEVTNYYQQYNFYYYMQYGYAPFDSVDDAARDYYGLRFDADWKAYQADFATKAVKQLLITSAIAKLNGFTVTEDEAKEWIRELARNNDATPADVLGYYSVEEIYAQIASEKAREILLAAVRFDYGDLLNEPEETLEN